MKQIESNLFKDPSTKSINKYKSESISQRVNSVCKEVLIKRPKDIFVNHQTQKIPKKDTKTEEQLRKRVKNLQNELKKNLCENGLMLKFFKSKNSSEMTHLDVYIEMKKFEELATKQIEQCGEIKQENERLSKAVEKFSKRAEKQEEEHFRNLFELQSQLEQKERRLKEENGVIHEEYRHKTKKYQSQLSENKLLMAELKRKNSQLSEKLNEKEVHLQDIKAHFSKDSSEVKAIYEKQIDYLKDNVEKLQVRLEESEENHSNMIADSQKIIENMQKEFEIQTKDRQGQAIKSKEEVQARMQRQLKQQQNLITQLQSQICALRSSLKSQVEKTQSHLITIGTLEDQRSQLNHHKQKLLQQAAKMEQKSMNYSAEVKKMKIERQEKECFIDKSRKAAEVKELKIEEMEKRIFELAQENNLLHKRSDESKRVQANSNNLQKFNTKLHNENYKAIGRLIELRKKVTSFLPKESEQKQLNEEELGEIVSSLGQGLDKFIKDCYEAERKSSQQMSIRHSKINREFWTVIDNLKDCIGQQARDVMSSYIAILRDDGSDEEREQVVQQLIKMLLNINARNNYHSDKPLQYRQCKDSLENTGQYSIKRRQECSVHETKHANVRREELYRSVKKRRQKSETEPAQDYLNRFRLYSNDQNNENYNPNSLNEKDQDSSKNVFKDIIKRKMSGKNLNLRQKEKEKEKKDSLKNEIYRKYFR